MTKPGELYNALRSLADSAAPVERVVRRCADQHQSYERDLAAIENVAAFPCGMTIDECAEALGISRQRVQQIEAAAVAKLKKRLGSLLD